MTAKVSREQAAARRLPKERLLPRTLFDMMLRSLPTTALVANRVSAPRDHRSAAEEVPGRERVRSES